MLLCTISGASFCIVSASVEVANVCVYSFLVMQVKPLKELAFNSPDITAGMTSRQFQVMMDVLTNLLFARAPRYSVYLVLLPF